MKSTSVLLLVVCASLVAMPSEAERKQNKFSGFYMGAGINVDYLTAKIHDNDESETNLGYAGLIGWRYQWNNNWVTGLEGALGDREGDLGDDVARFKFDYNWHWSATVGKVFGEQSNQLLYVKLGVGGIQVNGKVHGQKLTHNFKGVRSALGYERFLTENINVKAEVSYISYDSHFDFEQIQTGVSILYKF